MKRGPNAAGSLAAIAFVAFFAVFFAWPLIYATKGAFFIQGEPSLAAFRSVFGNPALRACFVRAFGMGLGATLLSLLLAVPAAFLIARHRFPGKGMLRFLVLAPLVLPPFVGVIGLKRLFGRYGTVNLWLMDLFGLEAPPVDWLSSDLLGVIVLQALHLYPIVYLNVHAAFLGIDGSLEEASANLGLGRLATIRRVFLPLVLPSAMAGAILVFVGSFSDLGTPLLMGVRDVIAVQVFDRVNDIGENPTGYALVLVVVAVSLGAFLLARAITPSQRGVGATKGAPRMQETPLRGLPAVAASAFISGLVIAALLPHVAVVLLSLAERWFLTPLPTAWSGRAYGLLVEHPLAVSSIQISISLASASTLVDLALGLVVAIGLTRPGSVPFPRFLDGLAMSPLAVPGIVLAFGLVGAFARTPLDPLTHSPWALLVAAYAVRRLPFAVRSLVTGFAGVSSSLEEAARNLGLTPRKTFLRVTLPLVSPHLIAGALLAFVFAVVEVSDSLVLAVKPEQYPMTKAIWELLGRLDDGPFVASAMGVLMMALLAVGFIAAGRVLGKKTGDVVKMGPH